jgi:hypothetical protein
MKQFRRRPLVVTAVFSALLLLAAAPVSASIIHIEFVAESFRGDLAIMESPLVPFPPSPNIGNYYTTATLDFAPIDDPSSMVSIPWQDVTIMVYNDACGCATRFPSLYDALDVRSSGPSASYAFHFFQNFNLLSPPGTGFLGSLSLSDPLPVFPLVCPSGTVSPCFEGIFRTESSWTLDGTFRTISFASATLETTTVPEPGLAALMSAAAAFVATSRAWRVRRLRRGP